MPHADRCPICRSPEIEGDEVWNGAPLRLAECRRCRHRWTAPASGPRPARAEPAATQRGAWRRGAPERPRFAA